jgi:hypothetical protein
MNYWYLTITSTSDYDSYSVTSIQADDENEAMISAQDYFEDKYNILASECDRSLMGSNSYWCKGNTFSAALMLDLRK